VHPYKVVLPFSDLVEGGDIEPYPKLLLQGPILAQGALEAALGLRDLQGPEGRYGLWGQGIQVPYQLLGGGPGGHGHVLRLGIDVLVDVGQGGLLLFHIEYRSGIGGGALEYVRGDLGDAEQGFPLWKPQDIVRKYLPDV